MTKFHEKVLHVPYYVHVTKSVNNSPPNLKVGRASLPEATDVPPYPRTVPCRNLILKYLVPY